MSPRILALLLSAGAAFLVYLNAYLGVFQFDDFNVIVTNRVVHSWQAWLIDAPHGIRPLLKLTYLLNWQSGLGTIGFHLVNNAIHICNTCLVYLLTARFFNHTPEGRPDELFSPPLLTALLFAIHPAQTEAITYICGRSTSLMTLCYLGSMLFYIQGKEEDNQWKLYIVSPLLFILAMLTKEIAVTLPFALLLWELSTEGTGKWSGIARRQAGHWALLLLFLFALLAHQRYRHLLLFSLSTRPVAENLLSEIHGINYLISRLFLFTRLNIDPDLPVIHGWSLPLVAEAAFLITLLATGIRALHRTPPVGFGILWFLLHLIPTNSVIPRLDVANDRQLYLASWGLFLASGYGIVALAGAFKRIPATRIATGVIFLLLACSTILRNRDYRSEIALWEDTSRQSPNKARVFNNLGFAYAVAGRNLEARKAYLSAIRLQPDFKLAHNNLGTAETILQEHLIWNWLTGGAPALLDTLRVNGAP